MIQAVQCFEDNDNFFLRFFSMKQQQMWSRMLQLHCIIVHIHGFDNTNLSICEIIVMLLWNSFTLVYQASVL